MLPKETIQNYLRGTCSQEELAAVHTWLDSNPKALESLLDEDEWNSFQPAEGLPQPVSDRFWQRIRLSVSRKEGKLISLKRWAVAASIVVLAGVGFAYYKSLNTVTDNGPGQQVASVREFINSTDVIESIVLPDSTLIKLYPGGRIRYPEQWQDGRRNVELSGTAFFDVQRDPARPFRVQADSIITTVLGTEFTIEASPDSTTLSIRLHEGKIAVQHSTQKFNQSISSYTLLPGDQFDYNKQLGIAKLIPAKRGAEPVAENKTLKKPAPVGALKGNNWYQFNNQPLSQVFDYLEQLYAIQISYNKEDLKGMTFIGKIDQSDSVENIIQSIVLLNNLTMQKTGSQYQVAKKK